MALRTIALLGIIVCASISDRSAAAPCERVGLYGDPEHCDKFYMCSPCGPLTFYCPVGTYFDRRSEACAVDAQNVCVHSKAVNGEDDVVVTPDTDITFDEFHTSCVLALQVTPELVQVSSEHDSVEQTSGVESIRGNEETSTRTENVNDGAETVTVTSEEVSPSGKELPGYGDIGVVLEKIDENSLTEQTTVASVDSLNSSRMRSSDGEDETVTTFSESIQLSKDSVRDCDLPHRNSIKPETSGEDANKNTDTNVEANSEESVNVREDDTNKEDDKGKIKGSNHTDKNIEVAFEANTPTGDVVEMDKMDVVFERIEYPSKEDELDEVIRSSYNTIAITTTPVTISNRTDSTEFPNAEELRSAANIGTYSVCVATILSLHIYNIFVS